LQCLWNITSILLTFCILLIYISVISLQYYIAIYNIATLQQYCSDLLCWKWDYSQTHISKYAQELNELIENINFHYINLICEFNYYELKKHLKRDVKGTRMQRAH